MDKKTKQRHRHERFIKHVQKAARGTAPLEAPQLIIDQAFKEQDGSVHLTGHVQGTPEQITEAVDRLRDTLAKAGGEGQC